MNNTRGMTLIQLTVVVAVVGVLAIALGFQFTGWLGNYRVESQLKELHLDLMNARVRAMKRNRVHFVNFPGIAICPPGAVDCYTTYEDDSDGATKVADGDGVFQPGAGNAADTELPSFPKIVDYNVNLVGTASTITFDRRGFIWDDNIPSTIGPINNVIIRITSNVTPDYDCLVLSPTRINLGQWNGANCISR